MMQSGSIKIVENYIANGYDIGVMVEHHLEIEHVMQILFISNEYDTSIKYKDVKTNTNG